MLLSISMKRLKEILSEKAFKEFGVFMCGQTGEILPDGTLGVYEEDFLKFVEKRSCTD